MCPSRVCIQRIVVFGAAADITMQQARKKKRMKKKNRQCALEAWRKSEQKPFVHEQSTVFKMGLYCDGD
jgi:hypothetical protein